MKLGQFTNKLSGKVWKTAGYGFGADLLDCVVLTSGQKKKKEICKSNIWTEFGILNERYVGKAKSVFFIFCSQTDNSREIT